VRIDGEERVQYDPGVGIYEPFRVPLSASYLEIFGDDEDGDLLLAVFPLPEPEAVEDDRAQQMFVTFERGQTLSIEVALGDGTGGEECEYVIHLSYSESLAGICGMPRTLRSRSSLRVHDPSLPRHGISRFPHPIGPMTMPTRGPPAGIL
jgi:hypothetical protein